MYRFAELIPILPTFGINYRSEKNRKEGQMSFLIYYRCYIIIMTQYLNVCEYSLLIYSGIVRVSYMKENIFLEKFPQLQNIPENRKRQMLDRLKTAPSWIAECFSLSVIQADETFVREGHPVTYVYYILEGTIKATEYRFYGVEFDYARFTKVYAMGGMEILMNIDTYRTTLRTIDQCTVLKIRKEDFNRWMMMDIHALRYESMMMGEYLLEQGRRAREDLFLPGPERLARLFVRKYERYSHNGILQLSMTRQELSNETGFTIKTISRAIKSLTEGGFITKSEKHYEVNFDQYNKLKKLIESIVAPESDNTIV